VKKLLEDQCVIVTGGGSGIGEGIARAYYEMGATLALIGRSDSVQDVANSLESKGKAKVYAIKCDLGDDEQLNDGFNDAIRKMGRVDVLVNSHGITHVAPALEHGLKEFRETLNINTTAVFQLCVLAARDMKTRGTGKIINIASAYSVLGGVNVSAYTASKGAVAQLTKALSNELASSGININAIIPGYVRTKLNKHIWDDPVRAKEVLGRIPAGRWGEPSDIAGAAIFLASFLSDYCNAAIIPVDGGFLAR